jgi:putative FmdB family regulatory protein
MPIYAYRCRSCGIHFERYQTFTDVALKLCPDCRKKTLSRIISLVGVVFKGPGFYSTDNRPSSPATSPASAQKRQKKRAHKEKTQPENASTASEKTD